MDKDKIQYNAATLYLEKKAYQVKHLNSKALIVVLLGFIYAVGFLIYKLIFRF